MIIDCYLHIHYAVLMEEYQSADKTMYFPASCSDFSLSC